MRWPNYWSFSFSISPSKEIPGLISFRMDCMFQTITLITNERLACCSLRYLPYFFKLEYSCLQQLVSAVQQSGSVIHIHISPFFGFPCSSRDSQESSPTPQFKSINSSVLSLLHSPTLTSIHDHWKNHSLD